jgi:hypothetical protein
MAAILEEESAELRRILSTNGTPRDNDVSWEGDAKTLAMAVDGSIVATISDAGALSVRDYRTGTREPGGVVLDTLRSKFW